MAKKSTKPKPQQNAPAPLPDVDAETPLAIEIPPLDEIPETVYCVRHVEGVLNHREALILKRLLHTLEFRGAQLEDGTYVKRPAHAMRWLLDRIDEQAE